MRSTTAYIMFSVFFLMMTSCNDGGETGGTGGSAGSDGPGGSAGSGGTTAPTRYCSEFVEKYTDGSCEFEYEACEGSPTCSLYMYCEQEVFREGEEEEELCACDRSGASRRDAQGRGCNLIMLPGPSGGGFCDAIGRHDPATIRKMIEDFCFANEKTPVR